MMDWVVWFVLAGLAVGVELFTGTFYLLMIAIGLVAGGLLALSGGSFEWQLLAAAVLAIVAVSGLWRSRFGKKNKKRTARDPNVNLDIGQSLWVDQWNVPGGAPTARVPYRGAQWDVELAPGNVAQAGQFIIQEVRGSRLIVVPSTPASASSSSSSSSPS